MNRSHVFVLLVGFSLGVGITSAVFLANRPAPSSAPASTAAPSTKPTAPEPVRTIQSHPSNRNRRPLLQRRLRVRRPRQLNQRLISKPHLLGLRKKDWGLTAAKKCANWQTRSRHLARTESVL